LGVHGDDLLIKAAKAPLPFADKLRIKLPTIAVEPYAKVSVINEFLGGYTISTNQNGFNPTISGVGIQAARGSNGQNN
jgi:hypothetical protein